MKEGACYLFRPCTCLSTCISTSQRIQSTCMQPSSRRPAEASAFRYPFGGMNGQSSR